MGNARSGLGYLGKFEGERYEEFIKACRNPIFVDNDLYECYHTSDSSCQAKFGVSEAPSIVLSRNFKRDP